MEINEVIESTRSLLRQGETGRALQTLIGFLEKDSRYAESVRTLQVVEANYHAARQQEIKGILSFQDAQRQYSQVNDALLYALDTLAAGRTPRLPATQKRSPLLYWVIGGAGMLLVGLLIGVWLNRKGQDKPAATTVEQTCPPFDPKDYRILLLPFQNLSDAGARPELALQTRIRDLTSRNNLMADVEIFPGTEARDNTPDIEGAGRIGRNCNADLVIWGQYDRSKDSINVDVRYVFTKGGLRSGVVGSKVLSNVAAIKNGKMLRDLDDAVLSLCSLIALHNGKPDLAKKWMAKMKQLDDRDKLVLEKIDEIEGKMEGVKDRKRNK